MCGRQKELDVSEAVVVGIASHIDGTAYYECHKSFSARASALIQQQNVKVDWGVRDNSLFCWLFVWQRANICLMCGSVAYLSGFCPTLATPKTPTFSTRHYFKRPLFKKQCQENLQSHHKAAEQSCRQKLQILAIRHKFLYVAKGFCYDMPPLIWNANNGCFWRTVREHYKDYTNKAGQVIFSILAKCRPSRCLKKELSTELSITDDTENPRCLQWIMNILKYLGFIC